MIKENLWIELVYIFTHGTYNGLVKLYKKRIVNKLRREQIFSNLNSYDKNKKKLHPRV
jgi:hypothetical protein